jgi:hypothetical protein
MERTTQRPTAEPIKWQRLVTRVPAELAAAMIEVASANRRSLSSEIALLCERHVEEHRRQAAA